MITNQPKSSKGDKRTQDKAKVSLLYLHYIFTNFFSIFCFTYKSLQNRENLNFRVLPASGLDLPTLRTLLLAIYNVELRFVPLSFPSTSICYILVLLWLILALH